jgi:hypothetical protein
MMNTKEFQAAATDTIRAIVPANVRVISDFAGVAVLILPQGTDFNTTLRVELSKALPGFYIGGVYWSDDKVMVTVAYDIA